ncbi:lysozyme inhibitor LprI family protein [Sporosarcina sp. BP05]|uniref:lysozyme inhibitor LprI family protein n=1 Tax=Sporosarcina sp. BP05 TaxID=2758726 RepID=UPI0016441FC1|nr:lysozyme inhibitor LprI family protein [Sporosarcina sp. BP05]
MKDFIDYYELLGVSPRASTELIHKAYRIGSKNTHPDLGGSEAEFIILHTAYETLMDKSMRRDYDKIYNGIENLKYNNGNQEKQDYETRFQSNDSAKEESETVNAEDQPDTEHKNRKPIWKYIISSFVLLSILAKLLSNFSFTDDNTDTPYNFTESSSSSDSDQGYVVPVTSDTIVGDVESKQTPSEQLDVISTSSILDGSEGINKNIISKTDKTTGGMFSIYLSQLQKIDEDLAMESGVWEFGSDNQIVGFTIDEYQIWDDKLNEIYGLLKVQLSYEDFNSLRKSQREWIKTRDIKAEEAITEFKGGSWEPAVYNSVSAEETRKRCYWFLEEYFN